MKRYISSIVAFLLVVFGGSTACLLESHKYQADEHFTLERGYRALFDTVPFEFAAMSDAPFTLSSYGNSERLEGEKQSGSIPSEFGFDLYMLPKTNGVSRIWTTDESVVIIASSPCEVTPTTQTKGKDILVCLFLGAIFAVSVFPRDD